MVKKLLSLLLACLILVTAAAAANTVSLYVDLEEIGTDVPPTIVDGRTLVPLRAIFEALGADVEWDGETRTATGTRGKTVVSVQIDNRTAYINGEPKELDVPAQIINDRTMVPARFISEAMGCTVTWDPDTRTAAVADKLRTQQIYVTKTGKHYHYSSTCNGGTYYEATLAEAMGRGLTPCDKCVLKDAPDPVEPDDVIAAALRENYRSVDPDGLLHLQSYHLLADETTGISAPGTQDLYEETVYLIVYHAVFRMGDTPEEISGGAVPAMLTFSQDADGGFSLKEFWTPEDGADYEDELRARFPEAAADEALDPQKYTAALRDDVLQQAQDYLDRLARDD